MEKIQVFRSYIHRVENILKELNSTNLENTDLYQTLEDLTRLNSLFKEYAKATNNGKGSSTLKGEKLKKLSAWLKAYSSNKDQMILDHIPKKLKNKDLVIDPTLLNKYQEYAEIAISYTQNINKQFQDVKKKVLPLLKIRERLEKDFSSFELEESDFPNADLLAADDFESLPGEDITDKASMVLTKELQEASPAKMINNVRSMLNIYGKYVKVVDSKYHAIIDQINKIGNLNLKELYNKLNQKNALIQSLFQNLVQINKLIHQSDFHYQEAFQVKYKELLRLCLRYLPEDIASKFLNDSNIREYDPIEEELSHAIRNVEKYDPLEDPEMDRISPHIPKYIAKQPEPKNLATIIPEIEEETETSDQISEDDKKKYEKLWEVASNYKINKLIRTAKILSLKY